MKVIVISGPTASGKTALSIKLAKELSRKATGDTLYILDEPTTGLHFEDINKLLKVLKDNPEKFISLSVLALTTLLTGKVITYRMILTEDY